MVGQSSPQASSRSLFGGAITCTVPPEFTDVSLLRSVPDNQEVFAHAATDSSLIVELLELTDSPHPATFHFHQLAKDSCATNCQLSYTTSFSPSSYPALISDDPNFTISFAYGTQTVSKFRDDDSLANVVNVALACVALPRANTHLLLIFNDPVQLHPQGNSAQQGVVVANPDETSPAARTIVLTDALRSLKILDWSLFC